MNETIISKILQENVTNYDLIASDFDKTRAVLWPEIEATAYLITPKTSVLDIGCGNGRLFPLVNKNGGKYLGFDNSEKLISISKKKYGENNFFVGDILNLKNNSNSQLLNSKSEVVYCLAVLHHIPSENLQLQVLKNINSFLKPGGTLVLSVWNLWQKKYFPFIAMEMVKKIKGESELDWGDCFIPYDHRDGIVKRFLHAFVLQELLLLVKKTGFQILSCQPSLHNYLLICKKS